MSSEADREKTHLDLQPVWLRPYSMRLPGHYNSQPLHQQGAYVEAQFRHLGQMIIDELQAPLPEGA